MYCAEAIFSSTLLFSAMLLMLQIPPEQNHLIEFYQFQSLQDEAAISARFNLSQKDCIASFPTNGAFFYVCEYSDSSIAPLLPSGSAQVLHISYPLFKDGRLQYLHIFKIRKN